ncbi:MAG: LysR family transcriptional regulator [Pseudomonadota bacterium]
MQHLFPLRLVEAIAKAGSIRAAAAELSITPSALNRRLLSIEEELDAPLFERTTVGVRLNAAGELFISHARRQMADMDRVRSQIEDLKGARRGRISVAIDDGLRASGRFASLLSRYQAEHPGVTFSVNKIRSSQIADQLADYSADLGFALWPTLDNSVTLATSAPICLHALVHEAHPLTRLDTVRLDQFVGFPCVVPGMNGALRMLLDAAVSKKNLSYRAIFEGPIECAYDRISNSDAVGLEADMAGADTVVGTGKVRIPLRADDFPRAFAHVVQLRGRTLSIAASRFAEMVKLEFAGFDS